MNTAGHREVSSIVSASPGSVRLRSRAPDLRFSHALAAGLVPRPPPGLSPRANSRGRAPPPSRVTLKCARFAGSCETARHKSSYFSIGFALAEAMKHRGSTV